MPFGAIAVTIAACSVWQKPQEQHMRRYMYSSTVLTIVLPEHAQSAKHASTNAQTLQQDTDLQRSVRNQRDSTIRKLAGAQ